MNGVEILSTTEVVAESTSNWWLAGFVFVGLIVFGGCLGFALSDIKIDGLFIGFILGAFVGFFGWAFVGMTTEIPTAYETHYKVTIDDSVSMNDFLDKYEILDQEGKIYTVKERE